eukprot:Clim_evm28s221 gene=Clim_evmTU28s221
MIWVGNKETNQNHDELARGTSASSTRREESLTKLAYTPRQITPKCLTVDQFLQMFSFDRFARNIRELNVMADQALCNWSSGTHNDGIAQIPQPTMVDVEVYDDGIIVDGTGFRAYDSSSCQAFVLDILDGYYPLEFKKQYPYGLYLPIVDERGSTHKPHFPGRGRRITSAKIPCNSLTKNDLASTAGDSSQLEHTSVNPFAASQTREPNNSDNSRSLLTCLERKPRTTAQ